jgi:NAD-dependent SIR2 family protein deacetylase
MVVTAEIERAAHAIRKADALLFTAGAGLGVDSGLPDFRGDEGFWNAYPPFRRLGLSFMDLANPRWFVEDPALAWGFYGHRLGLYRRTRPHHGFALVRRWAAGKRHGAFVMTSNVDGQFQRAGFDPDRVFECHGAIEFLQCTGRCGVGIFPAEGVEVSVDPETFRARPPLPRCPRCGALARPNILMFDDDGWDDERSGAQQDRFNGWLHTLTQDGGALVVVECGAGTAIPTVRGFGEQVARATGGLLVRINPRESQAPTGHVSLALGAREGLRALDTRVGGVA